ncbi:MAG: hypothetical protein WCC10_12040 [Tumebacillaceae bacterium]
MTRKRSNFLLFLVCTLILFVIAEGVGIYRQNQQIKLLEVTGYSMLSGNINETIGQIDRFVQTKDRAVLENLYVRMELLERESQRSIELIEADPVLMKSTTPSGLVGLIMMHNISNEQAADYLKKVQEKLRTYQEGEDPAVEIEHNRLRYIQVWRELFQLADQKHQEWKLP